MPLSSQSTKKCSVAGSGLRVSQPPLFNPLKCHLDHLEGAPPMVAFHLVRHGKGDSRQLVDRLGKAIVGVVGAAQHALGDSMLLVPPGIACGLVHHQREHLARKQTKPPMRSGLRLARAVARDLELGTAHRNYLVAQAIARGLNKGDPEGAGRDAAQARGWIADQLVRSRVFEPAKMRGSDNGTVAVLQPLHEEMFAGRVRVAR